MDERTRQQKGSPTRDLFKRKHKELCAQFYSIDIDFVFVEKVPFPDIVAAIDYKAGGDGVTFAEVISYNALIRRGVPVFIVTGDAESGSFRIEEYVGGHHGKPRCDLEFIGEVGSWFEFGEWEADLRNGYKRRFST